MRKSKKKRKQQKNNKSQIFRTVCYHFGNTVFLWSTTAFVFLTIQLEALSISGIMECGCTRPGQPWQMEKSEEYDVRIAVTARRGRIYFVSGIGVSAITIAPEAGDRWIIGNVRFVGKIYGNTRFVHDPGSICAFNEINYWFFRYEVSKNIGTVQTFLHGSDRTDNIYFSLL